MPYNLLKHCLIESSRIEDEDRDVASLERVVYESRATGSTDSLLNVATILAESQRNNDRDGLTGALAAHDGRYLQVIEGAPAALDRLMRRLDGDPRHREVSIIDRVPIEARAFDGWSMASARISPDLVPVLDRVMGEPSGRGVVALLLDAVRQN